MRKVSIGQLSKSLSKELNNLPFEITSRGVSFAIVQKISRSMDKPTGTGKLFKPYSKEDQTGRKKKKGV